VAAVEEEAAAGEVEEEAAAGEEEEAEEAAAVEEEAGAVEEAAAAGVEVVAVTVLRLNRSPSGRASVRSCCSLLPTRRWRSCLRSGLRRIGRSRLQRGSRNRTGSTRGGRLARSSRSAA